MTVKTAVSRDSATFANRYTYRELTYKLATRLLKDAPDDIDKLFEELKAEATEQPANTSLNGTLAVLGLIGYELTKVEEYLIPETLNSVTRGIASKDGKDVRFYVERP